MNKLLLLPILLLCSCAPVQVKRYHTAAVAAPSLDAIGAGVSSAQASTSRASALSTQIGGNANDLGTDASRVDAKATVVLKWLK